VSTLAGRYRLVERLGAGGMSVVWRAYDEVLGRQVAVKVLASGYAADPAFRAGVRREARAAARLSHPHITNVYDYGEAVGQDGSPVPFVVMELVEGHTLAQRLAGGALPWRAVLEIGRQVAGALSAAHARGLVHRDVTPANIMLAADGVKVVDFGISAIVGERGEQIILGTPAYLAPERLSGAPAQPATDVYSLGLVLYHALAGGLPPAPMPAVPPAVAALVARCMAADPGHRPDSRTLAHELAILAGAAVPVRPALGVPAAAVPAGPTGTRVMPPPGRTTHGRKSHPPFGHPRRGRLLLPVALLSVVLLLLWGFSTLRSHRSTASPGPSHVTAGQSSPAPDRHACAVAYKVTLDFGSYFTAELAIQNTGKAPMDGWMLEFDFPQDQRVTTGWAGAWKQTDSHVQVRDLIYNGSVAQGKAITIGFIGSHHSRKNEAPSRFTVNGVRCQQAAQG
jgi:eukaryotic-like serine/threonine-protein kinase